MRKNGVIAITAGVVASSSAACALGLWLAGDALEGTGFWTRAAGATAVCALSVATVIVPVVALTVRESERLLKRFEAVAAGGEEPANLVAGSALLRPLARTMRAASERTRGEIDSLRAKLREIEIRQRLSEAERDHAHAILNSLQDAVIVTDAFDELASANGPATRLLGVRPDDDLHRPIDEVIDDERLRSLIRDVRSAGVLPKQKRVEHVMTARAADAPHADGHTPEPPASFDVTLACLPDGRDGVGGVVTILRDVTREREIAQMKSDFVSQASHELRTPLSSINAYIEMLLDAEAEDEESRQEFYGVIKAEADRVSRMIDNMLNISRIEAGIHSVECSEVDLVKVCGEVLETMQAGARTKDTKLALKSGPLVYTAAADRDMIFQVVMNLVSNAVKYTPEGGRVTVHVENDDATRSVLVTVADTGLGIPPDALERVFDKFYRIENYKRVAKGTGLGLNLCKHIVETVHHGRIGVESEMGMGSRFWFSIPYENEPATRGV